MDQRDRIMSSSSSGNGDKAGKANNRQHGPGTQDPPSHPSINCPRCDSVNTKFCYYNNYSQTQPRHFCKSCRRYWTQGGTLRNVPVGGGCRKNKRVRPRSLMSLGGLQEVGPTSFSDTASNMLGRLPNFGNGGNNFDVSNDTSGQLLNIAFARFQESMRLRQQSAQSSEGTQFADMSLPALVHKPCGLSSCTGGTSCINRASHLVDGAACGAPGLIGDGFNNHLGYTPFHGESGYSNINSFDIANPVVYAPTTKIHNMMGTSATATLASIEDELSNFSNLQYHVNLFNADAAKDCKSFDLTAMQAGASQRLATVPLPLMEHGGAHDHSYVDNSQQMTNTDLASKHGGAAGGDDEEQAREEKLSMMRMNGDNGLSLMMCADNWQQAAASTNELLYHEPHQSMMWSSNAARWQDMHPLASSTAAAGTAL